MSKDKPDFVDAIYAAREKLEKSGVKFSVKDYFCKRCDRLTTRCECSTDHHAENELELSRERLKLALDVIDAARGELELSIDCACGGGGKEDEDFHGERCARLALVRAMRCFDSHTEELEARK